MLTPSDWRFVAEGNAHLVYRYVGPQSDSFSGMVLKLPKSSAADDERLLHQHKFVQRIVAGDPFSQRERVHQTGSFSVSADDSDGEFDDDENSDSELDLSKQWKSLDFVPSHLVEKSDQASLIRCSSSAPLIEEKPSSTQKSFQARRIPADRGLVSPVHIPCQQLHLFEDRHTVKLREQVHPSKKTLDPADLNSSPFDQLKNANRCPPVAPTACTPPPLDVHATPEACNSRPHIDGPVHAVSSLDVSSLPDLPLGVSPEASRSSFALLERDLVTPPVVPSRLLSVGVHCQRSSERYNKSSAWAYFTCELKPKTGLPAVVEAASTEMLSTPAPNQLPTVEPVIEKRPLDDAPNAIPNPSQSNSASAHPTPAPNQPTPNQPTPNQPPQQPSIEAQLNQPIAAAKSGSHQPQQAAFEAPSDQEMHISRFTMQQHLKMKRKEVQARSHYNPETFFGRLSERSSVTHQLRSLLHRPQNNWRLFVDGARVIWTSDQRPHGTGHSPRFLSTDLKADLEAELPSSPALSFAISTSISGELSGAHQPSHITLGPISPHIECIQSSPGFQSSPVLIATPIATPIVEVETTLAEPQSSLVGVGEGWGSGEQNWSASMVLAIKPSESSEPIQIPPAAEINPQQNDAQQFPSVEAFGSDASEIFPFWMSWSRSLQRLAPLSSGVAPRRVALNQRTGNQNHVGRNQGNSGNGDSGSGKSGNRECLRNEEATVGKEPSSSAEHDKEHRDSQGNEGKIEVDLETLSTPALGRTPATQRTPALQTNESDLGRFQLLSKISPMRLVLSKFGLLPVIASFSDSRPPSSHINEERTPDQLSHVPHTDMSDLSITEKFHHQFPTEVFVSETEPLSGLAAVTDLMAEVVYLESNLFYRLLYVHALCEGQQHVAAALLAQLESVGFFLGESGEPGLNLIDQKLMSDAHGAKSLQEFLVGMEADIARDKDWVFGRSQKADCDPEAMFALRVQTWHYKKGKSLVEAGRQKIANGEGFTSEHKDAVVHWIYRFLIGRTFLDCSVMINVAVSVDQQVSEEEVEDFLMNRFLRLATLPVSDILQYAEASASDPPTPDLSTPDPQTRNPPTPDPQTRQSPSTGHSNPVSGPTHTNSSPPSVEAAVLAALHHLQVPIYLPPNQLSQDSSSSGSRSPTQPSRLPIPAASRHDWAQLVDLLKSLSTASESPPTPAPLTPDPSIPIPLTPAPTVTVWYRLSVVDLDLKQASKIPSWAVQLDNVRAAFAEFLLTR